MTTLTNKIDFIAVIEARNTNPNGDPLNANRPRTDMDGYGLITDVAIKRKIRNRWQDMGEDVYIQNTERPGYDGHLSMADRLKEFAKDNGIKLNAKTDIYQLRDLMTEKWIDVRGFGNVVAHNSIKNVSLGITGATTVTFATSLEPVNIIDTQIVKSVNGDTPTGNSTKSSDTMGVKSMIDYGVYVFYGSITPQSAGVTGFTEEDAEKLKLAIHTLFENDATSARPSGSLSVKDLFWFTHSSSLGNVSSKRVFDLLEHDEVGYDVHKPTYEDYNVRLNEERLAEYTEKGLELEHLPEF